MKDSDEAMVFCKSLIINTSPNKASKKKPLILERSEYQQVMSRHRPKATNVKFFKTERLG